MELAAVVLKARPGVGPCDVDVAAARSREARGVGVEADAVVQRRHVKSVAAHGRGQRELARNDGLHGGAGTLANITERLPRLAEPAQPVKLLDHVGDRVDVRERRALVEPRDVGGEVRVASAELIAQTDGLGQGELTRHLNKEQLGAANVQAVQEPDHASAGDLGQPELVAFDVCRLAPAGAFGNQHMDGPALDPVLLEVKLVELPKVRREVGLLEQKVRPSIWGSLGRDRPKKLERGLVRESHGHGASFRRGRASAKTIRAGRQNHKRQSAVGLIPRLSARGVGPALLALLPQKYPNAPFGKKPFQATELLPIVKKLGYFGGSSLTDSCVAAGKRYSQEEPYNISIYPKLFVRSTVCRW